jgi:hypothetical protein
MKPEKMAYKPSASGGSGGLATTNFLKDSHWAHVFMPTITHALYISRKPFVDFTSKSPEFLITMQNALNLSFPNVNFELAPNDPIIEMVWISSQPYPCLLANSKNKHLSGL